MKAKKISGGVPKPPPPAAPHRCVGDETGHCMICGKPV